jgi:DNA polymerase III sliding clamp (beta) subunit (PCNA family)
MKPITILPTSDALEWRKSVTVPSGPILEAMTFSSKDQTRYVLQGVYFDKDSIVATDGRKLYHRTGLKLEPVADSILPAEQDVRGFLRAHDYVRIETSNDKRHFRLTNTIGEKVVKAIEGNFPNYKQVMPDINTCVYLSYEAEALLRALKALPKTPKGASVTLTVRNGLSAVSAVAPNEKGKAKTYTESFFARANGDLTILLNREWFTAAVKQGFDTAYLKDAESPILLVKAETKYVQMPMKQGA